MIFTKEILEKLKGTWKTTISHMSTTVDIELNIKKNAKGNVKYITGTNTKVIFFKIEIGEPLEFDNLDSCYEINLSYTKTEFYQGNNKKNESYEKGSLYTIVAFSGNDIYLPFFSPSRDGNSKKSRILSLDNAYKRSEGKEPLKNSVLDLIFSGSSSILVMAGIDFNKELTFVEACDETKIYELSRLSATIYDGDDKFRKLGCTLERVERFIWIYSLFTERRDYMIERLVDHWESIEAIDTAFEREQKKFKSDLPLALYWVLHFGLLQDRRVDEVKNLINELLPSLNDEPFKELLKDALLLTEYLKEGKTVPSLSSAWYEQYYQNIYATSFNRSYSACLHALVHHNQNKPNTKAFWVVKTAQNLDDWSIIESRIKEANVDNTYKGISFIQANNPNLSLEEQSDYAEQYLNEMMDNFHYRLARNSLTSIIMIYKKVKDYSLVEKVTKCYFEYALEEKDSDETIEQYTEIVDYLHAKGLTNLKPFQPIEEVIFEKIDAYGYTQIILRYFKKFISQKVKSLNEEKVDISKITGRALKAKFKKLETTIQKEGYTKVSSSGELLKSMTDPLPEQTIFKMNYGEFHTAYPDIYLDDDIWYNNFYVYTEDMSFDTTLDLDISDIGHIFLKNLTVKGDILNENSDDGAPLLVKGKTFANSIIAGGSFLTFEGDVTLKDLLAVYYNHGETSFEGKLTARVVLDDDDHSFGKPSEFDIQYLFVNYYLDKDTTSYKILDYKKLATILSDKSWLSEEDDEITTSSWSIVENINNYGRFTNKIVKEL